MKQILEDKELLKLVINQGASSLILTILTVSVVYLSFNYVPVFVKHVGSLATSTAKIDMHLATMVNDTKKIKDTDELMFREIKDLKKVVEENNLMLKKICR